MKKSTGIIGVAVLGVAVNWFTQWLTFEDVNLLLIQISEYLATPIVYKLGHVVIIAIGATGLLAIAVTSYVLFLRAVKYAENLEAYIRDYL